MFELLADAATLQQRLLDIRAEAADAGLSEGECIDVLRGFEELKSALAAAQAEVAVMFDHLRRQQEDEAGMPARERGRGVGNEIALGRRESPHRGGRLLGLARALVGELPHTRRALQLGLISEWQATIIVRETACLTLEHRGLVDEVLAADAGKTQGWGDRQLAAQVRRHAAKLDPASVVRRAAKAAADRHITCRPAPDTMVRLSVLAPVAQGIGIWAALSKEADRLRGEGDPRSRGQLMVDLLADRVTGIATGQGLPTQVRLTITDRALFNTTAGEGRDDRTGDPAAEAAWLDGYGSIPAEVARNLVSDAVRGLGAWFRQVYTHPISGALLAMSSRSRRAPRGLADFIDARDQTCRTPWCDAPIRHHDHVWAAAAGGPTDAGNLQGLCESCNQAKEAPGWRARPRPGPRHVVVTTTPTGHTYESQAPPPVGHDPSPGELYTLADRRVTIAFSAPDGRRRRALA